MKTLYLHIGCGKTGSSALQVWLWNNQEDIGKEGLLYPKYGDKAKLNDYSITTGNGVILISKIREGGLTRFLKGLSYKKEDVLFSSEVFQNLNDKELEKLGKVAERVGFNVKIIAFVRDVYDMAYSSYLQLVKRGGYFHNFEHFAFSCATLQQFQVIKKFEKVFDNIKLIHYDTAKKQGVDVYFADAVGIDYNRISPMAKKKVNRSLTLFELQLMRAANLAAHRRGVGDEFCTSLSDKLIYADPEKDSELFLDFEALSYLKDKFEDDVAYINNKYFEDLTLNIFDPEGKSVIEELPEVPEEFSVIVEGLVEYFSVNYLSKKLAESRSSKNDSPADLFQSIDPADERVIQFLIRQASLKLHESLDDSITLMQAAKVFRPQGPVVNKILKDYQEKKKGS